MMRKILSVMAGVLLAMTAGPAYAVSGGGNSVTIENVTFSGFVETIYTNNTRTGESTFMMDQVELDIEKTIDGVGGLRFDLQYIQHDGYDGLTTDEIVEQGYVWLDIAGVAKFTLGKFNAPIGFENIDPDKRYQFSNSMVFYYGAPINLTGAMISGGTGIVDVALYVANGWDSNQDNNEEKTFGGRVGVTPAEGVNFGVSYITGDESVDSSSSGSGYRSVNAVASSADPKSLSALDLDLTITAIHHLIIGAEFNRGKFEKMSSVKPGDDAEWTAWLVMANYHFHDRASMTVRYDVFDDEGGARLGSGVAEERSAITLAPTYYAGGGLKFTLEYKYTKSDKDVFKDEDGSYKGNQTEVTLKGLYSF